MSDVFQEVDEELKRQQLDRVMRTYGPWIIGAAVLIVAAYAAYVFWTNYQESRAASAADQLIAGMEQLVGGSPAEAATTFGALAEDAPGGYEVLARLQEAAALRQAGNTESAIALYDEIAADGSVAPEYRDLARFYGGLAAVGAGDVYIEDVATRLEPVATGSSPWRFHAREILGFAAYRAGNYELAASHYQQLTDDPLVPAGIAARASEMINLTEVSAR